MSDTLPMFPLNTVLFPGVSVPLHVFEDRYRALVHHLLRVADPADRLFGSVAIREGYEVGDHGAQSLYRVGCRVQLTEVEAHADGTFDIVAVGLDRIAAGPARHHRARSRSGTSTDRPDADRPGARGGPRAGPGHVHGLPGGAGATIRGDPYPGDAAPRPDVPLLDPGRLAPLPMPERQALLEAEDAADAAGRWSPTCCATSCAP